MSQLPQAPLIEVIFELRWPIDEPSEWEKVRYLPGDLFAKLKDKYKDRSALVPVEIPLEWMVNKPMYRYRVAENDYPLVQVGPGLVTVNTVDPKYYWKEYRGWIMHVIEQLYNCYEFAPDKPQQLVLRYLDFLPFDFHSGDVLRYLRDNLHIQLSQDFFANSRPALEVGLNLGYETPQGTYHMQLSKGQHRGEEGILLQTMLSSQGIKNATPDAISAWLEEAHTFTHDRFVQMTQGPLYDSFQ